MAKRTGQQAVRGTLGKIARRPFERRRQMKIKFSHHYPKLHSQTAAHLLHIELRDRSELSEAFIKYDTVYEVRPAIGPFDEAVVDHYPLPSGRLMVLVFLGNNLFPFTTVRRWTAEKERYYRNGIGKRFDIEYVAAENSGAPGNIAQQAAGMPLETAPDRA
jgi:hypothetical protein